MRRLSCEYSTGRRCQVQRLVRCETGRSRPAYTCSAISYRSSPLFHRRPEIHVPLNRLINFFGQEEDRDSRGYGSAGVSRQGDGRHVYVARQVENDNKVVAAKSEIKRLEFPAHFLDQLLDYCLAFRTAFLNKPLQAVLGVGALTEIFWHVILLCELTAWQRSNDHSSQIR